VLRGTTMPSADSANDLLPPSNRVSPLPVAAVKIHDSFWAPRLQVNRTRTRDHVLKQIEGTGRRRRRYDATRSDASSSSLGNSASWSTNIRECGDGISIACRTSCT
jgi:hypothetical protein